MRFCFFFLFFLASSLSAMGPLKVVGVRAALFMQDKKKSQDLHGISAARSNECVACAYAQEEQEKQFKSLLRRDRKSYDLKRDSEGSERIRAPQPSISPDTSNESTSSAGSVFERDYPFSAHGIAKPITVADENEGLSTPDLSDVFRGWAWAYDEPDDGQSLADVVRCAAAVRVRRNSH